MKTINFKRIRSNYAKLKETYANTPFTRREWNEGVKPAKQHFHNWIDDLLVPFGKLVGKQLNFKHFKVVGPFGLGNSTSFYMWDGDDGQEWDKAKTTCFTVRPCHPSNNPNDVSLDIVSEDAGSGTYAQNSLGAMNGFHHPTEAIPDMVTMEWQSKFLSRE